MINEGMDNAKTESRRQNIRKRAEDLEKYASEVKDMAWRVRGILFGEQPASDKDKGKENAPGLIGRIETNNQEMFRLLGSAKDALRSILEELE